jgi:hypothetical protein
MRSQQYRISVPGRRAPINSGDTGVALAAWRQRRSCFLVL